MHFYIYNNLFIAGCQIFSIYFVIRIKLNIRCMYCIIEISFVFAFFKYNSLNFFENATFPLMSVVKLSKIVPIILPLVKKISATLKCMDPVYTVKRSFVGLKQKVNTDGIQ